MNESFICDWVLTRKIALGRAPKDPKHIKVLHEEGIKSIFTLCGEEDFKFSKNLLNQFKCQRFVLPDHKEGRLPSIDELINALKILKKLQNFAPTYIHCVASMERSPIVCIAWLVYECGYSPDVALAYVMQVHKGTSPLAGQLQLIDQLMNLRMN